MLYKDMIYLIKSIFFLMAKLHSLINGNAQSKFGLKSIEALFRNSKQRHKT